MNESSSDNTAYIAIYILQSIFCTFAYVEGIARTTCLPKPRPRVSCHFRMTCVTIFCETATSNGDRCWGSIETATSSTGAAFSASLVVCRLFLISHFFFSKSNRSKWNFFPLSNAFVYKMLLFQCFSFSIAEFFSKSNRLAILISHEAIVSIRC